MHLGFLLCRQWVPLPQVAGTPCSTGSPLHTNVATALSETLTADGWEDRAAHLADALDALADHQGQLGIPTSSPTRSRHSTTGPIAISTRGHGAPAARQHPEQ